MADAEDGDDDDGAGEPIEVILNRVPVLASASTSVSKVPASQPASEPGLHTRSGRLVCFSERLQVGFS